MQPVGARGVTLTPTVLVTMRRLADAMGIRAPSLYKHLPHKTALETAIVIDGFEQAATAFEAVTRDADEPLAAFVAAYRAFAAAHPHVYRLMTERRRRDRARVAERHRRLAGHRRTAMTSGSAQR